MFISIEGIDGCGKSTIANKLYNYLTKKGKDCILTREPGGTKVSDKCRDILLNSDYLDNRAEIMLFLASRAQHVAELIIPSLKAGKWIITDRYADSFFAYQSFGRENNIDFETLKKINDFACYNVYPNKTIYLSIDVETSLARQTDPDRISKTQGDFFNKIKQGFDELCEIFPERYIKIDATQNIDTVFNSVIKKLNV